MSMVLNRVNRFLLQVCQPSDSSTKEIDNQTGTLYCVASFTLHRRVNQTPALNGYLIAGSYAMGSQGVSDVQTMDTQNNISLNIDQLYWKLRKGASQGKYSSVTLYMQHGTGTKYLAMFNGILVDISPAYSSAGGHGRSYSFSCVHSIQRLAYNALGGDFIMLRMTKGSLNSPTGQALSSLDSAYTATQNHMSASGFSIISQNQLVSAHQLYDKVVDPKQSILYNIDDIVKVLSQNAYDNDASIQENKAALTDSYKLSQFIQGTVKLNSQLWNTGGAAQSFAGHVWYQNILDSMYRNAAGGTFFSAVQSVLTDSSVFLQLVPKGVAQVGGYSRSNDKLKLMPVNKWTVQPQLKDPILLDTVTDMDICGALDVLYRTPDRLVTRFSYPTDTQNKSQQQTTVQQFRDGMYPSSDNSNDGKKPGQTKNYKVKYVTPQPWAARAQAILYGTITDDGSNLDTSQKFRNNYAAGLFSQMYRSDQQLNISGPYVIGSGCSVIDCFLGRRMNFTISGNKYIDANRFGSGGYISLSAVPVQYSIRYTEGQRASSLQYSARLQAVWFQKQQVTPVTIQNDTYQVDSTQLQQTKKILSMVSQSQDSEDQDSSTSGQGITFFDFALKQEF